MGYKSLLTIATDAHDLHASLTAAAELALQNDAHLDVLAMGIDLPQIGYAYLGAAPVLLEATFAEAEKAAADAAKAVKKCMDEQPQTLRWSLETAVVQLGTVPSFVAQQARFADLVVLGQPYGKMRSTAAEAVLEAVLFQARAPVLVVPDTGLAKDGSARKIVIGWNESREALAAVRSAMPMLRAAARVNIAVIDPPVHGAERSDPGGALCQMLVRHGVKAEVSVLAKSMPRVSDILARHVEDQDAGLLVMGAYGHSRFTEAILGGATRNALTSAKVPIFLAH